MPRYVIIGSGIAGMSAIQALRNSDPAGEIVLISDDPNGYYSRPGMAYYLTGEINAESLFPFTAERFDLLGARRIQDRVTQIFPYRHSLECASGTRLSYDRLLIATGSTAMGLNVPGFDLDGVVSLDQLEDAKRIFKMARKGRSAVVVGGGITALELVEGLTARGVQVHLFMRGSYFWQGVLEEREARIVEERLREEGVQIHPCTEIAEIIGHRDKVAGVTMKDGQRLAVEMVAVAVGVRPVLGLAAACAIQTDRGILVNQWMQTSQPDIFAAGDVAQVYDQASKKWVVESLWGTARLQGWHAGLNMAGMGQAYVRPPAVNVTRLAGVATTIIGAVGQGNVDDLVTITHGDSESWRDTPEALITRIDFDVNHMRLMVAQKTLVGAVVMGEQSLTPILRELVTRQVDISAIRSDLIAPGAQAVELIKNFWNTVEVQADRTS